MSLKMVKTHDPQQKIKKVLVLEWRQEEEISENEARKLIHQFSKQKKVCQKHRSMVTSSKKIENSRKSNKSIGITPVSSRKKRIINKIKSRTKSNKNVSKISTSKKSRSSTRKSRSSTRKSNTSYQRPLPKKMNIKETLTDIKINNGNTEVTKQKIKIPYKLFWRPTVTESGKEGITFKIQVQDLDGRKMELDVSCPGFTPNKVRLNGINLKKL